MGKNRKQKVALAGGSIPERDGRLRNYISTVLSIIAVSLSIFVWYDGSTKWNTLNRERLSLEETKFIPIISVPIENEELKIPFQGITTDFAAAFSADDPERSRIESHTYFTFWNSRRKERLKTKGIFAYLAIAEKEKTRLSHELNLDENDIEIKQTKRIAAKFKNTGNLPIQDLRCTFNYYFYDSHSWTKAYPDEHAKIRPYLSDLLNAGQELWLNFECGAVVLSELFPQQLLVQWIVKYRDTSGTERTVVFFRYFGKDISGNSAWQVLPANEREAIISGAKQLSEDNYYKAID